MKRKLLFFSLAALTCLCLASCNKDKDKVKDPLNATIWTAYDSDNLMVLRFNLGTVATFFIGDDNLQPKGTVFTANYTLADDTKITFVDLDGSLDTDFYRLKNAVLDGETMTVKYDRWTQAAGIVGQHEHLQAVFKKKAEPKKK